ncbi:MAG: methyltransferase domain-containing protein [Deltaproteobacteria bacterium]|nr:methyltransferase domain-containing protein [Deltaproteobacteria bacterium]
MHPIKQLSDNALIELCTSIYHDTRQRAEVSKLFLTEASELSRVRKSLELIPPATKAKSTLVDLGFATYWIPAYFHLGYDRVIGITKYKNGHQVSLDAIENWQNSESVDVMCLDIDTNMLPVEDASVDVVCCFELLEHLALDPMLMFSEANRILKLFGNLVLTTPNISSWLSVLRIVQGNNPNNWSAFSPNIHDSSLRHKREYTPYEVQQLAESSGFTIDRLFTNVNLSIHSRRMVAKQIITLLLLAVSSVPVRYRGPIIFSLARKTAPVAERYPKWLYHDFRNGPRR